MPGFCREFRLQPDLLTAFGICQNAAGSSYEGAAIRRQINRVLAYQLDRPDLGRGVIFAFRRQDCETESFRVTPELKKGVRYVFEDIQGGNPLCINGGEPFDIAIPDKRGSRLILYRKEE